MHLELLSDHLVTDRSFNALRARELSANDRIIWIVNSHLGNQPETPDACWSHTMPSKKITMLAAAMPWRDFVVAANGA
jgi:hypothetical protein